MPETKTCEACKATIGESDKNCPACGEDLEVLDLEVKSVERANRILEERKAKAAPPVPAPQPQPQPKTSILRGLAMKKVKR